MRLVRYTVLAVILVLAVTVALANRAPVTLALWPDTVSAFTGLSYSITLPLFVVLALAVGLGLVLGLIWEWLRERSIRAEAARNRRELERLRAAQGVAPAAAVRPERDEVLAILDEPPARS